MVDRKKGLTLASEVAKIVDAHNELVDLMFTNGVNLSKGGRGVIAELKRRGGKQKDASRILDIAPSAIGKHWHDDTEDD